jgi:thiol-disulfide isomerase/thioredoxin
MSYMTRTTLFIAAILSVLLLSCRNESPDTDQSYVMPPEIEQLPVGTTLGLRAPEIALPGPEGETMRLSSLRGKLVLVDFWAAWCNPCRRENPELVKLYNKYHNASFTKGEGFEIYSVSLDRNEEAWKQAVEQDKLNWPYQVGDLKGARTQPAQDYNVEMIPNSFLLDQHGVVIATNLRSEALEEKLESLLKK